MAGRVTAVIGGQYGSEGKGVIVNHMAKDYNVHVRVGGPNAGHSFYHMHQRYAMQSIPCGWTNREATLVIGAGAVIDLATLKREVEQIEALDSALEMRLKIDPRAIVITPDQHKAEGGVEGELHQRIGSTGEGVGAARHARMARDPLQSVRFGEVAEGAGLKRFVYRDTAELLYRSAKRGESILLEGTQGSGLSLIHGPWPYVTSADTNAAQLLADCGLAPGWLTDVLLVFRTYPIRVAGNSGPLAGEMTWEEISNITGQPTIERTTVTKKVRRIGRWDDSLAYKAVMLNKPTMLAFTFLDYLDPRNAEADRFELLTPETRRWVSNQESKLGAPSMYLGVGGPEWSVIDRRLEYRRDATPVSAHV